MSRLAATGLLLGCFLANAQGQLYSPTERWSGVAVHAEIPEAPPPDDFYEESIADMSLDPFDEWVEGGTTWNGIYAGGRAEQQSSLSANSIQTSGLTRAFSDEQGTPGPDALSWSSSLFELEFDLDAAIDAEFLGELHETIGDGPPYLVSTHATLSIWDGEYYVGLMDFDTGGSFFTSDTLGPGHYLLHVEAFVGTELGPGDSLVWGEAGYDVTLVFIPEPSTALMLVAVGLTALRRRDRIL